ncbi:MAG: hypothetical protein JXR83_14075 [Deltaproteobacteria bacterium]|nr:hypothetical protein [Deltaproteobacteria bacterium]
MHRAIPLLLLASCAPPADPGFDTGDAGSEDTAIQDSSPHEHGGSDAARAEAAAAVDAGSEDAFFNGCAFDYQRITLRAVDERQWLRYGDAPVIAASSGAPGQVEVTVVGGVAEVRARAAGSASIALDDGALQAAVQVEVDLSDSIFATAVASVTYGTGAGFGQEHMPGAVLGPPTGGGSAAGSIDVVSLGLGGSITVELGVDAVDGQGNDLIVFENPFVGFIEPARVEVSLDGRSFVAFACDPVTAAGCAGVNPVVATGVNGVDPTDPEVAGGDAFDLAEIGVARVRYVRITDVGGIDLGGGKAGFDLDAVVAVNSVAPTANALAAPEALSLEVGQTRAPRVDVVGGGSTLYGAPVVCTAEPPHLVEIDCGCRLTGRAVGSAVVSARLGDLSRQLTVTVAE